MMRASTTRRVAPAPGQARSLWERVNPRRMQRSAWHRLRRCSRACPLPHRPCKLQDPGRSHGLYRNGTNPGPGTIPVGAGSPAKNATQCLAPAVPVFAGKPAPTPTVPASRSLAMAMAFTEMAPTLGQAQSLWERARPRRMQHGAWHRPCRCSRACPLPHRPCKLQDPWPRPWPSQKWHQPRARRNPCGSGFTREECNTVHGTGCADVRGSNPIHTNGACLEN